MNKELTEQWRNGTLERGYYYYLTKVGAKVIGYQCFGLKFPYDYYHNTIDSVEEVLASVPSYGQYIGLMDDSKELDKAYDKINLLEKKLELAKKALKDCYNDMKYWAVLTRRNQRILSVIKQALKEMEGVK